MFELFEDDINYVLQKTKKLWGSYVDARIFLTGGTGFFGRWLVATFLAANEQFNLNAKLTILSRDPENFSSKYPLLRNYPSLNMVAGDIKDFGCEDRSYTHIIHAATDVDNNLNERSPDYMLDTILNGTNHLLSFARKCAHLKNILLVSSGAIYGSEPGNMTVLPESYQVELSQLKNSAYAKGKYLAEQACLQFADKNKVSVMIARAFSFVGPYLPLDTHFAIGNFINYALHNKTIHVKGDGSPIRSYMYAADLAISLWTILSKGENKRAYNVGSNEAITMKELANKVKALCNSDIEIIVEGDVGKIGASSRYLPDITLLLSILEVSEMLNIEQSISRTMEWYKQRLDRAR